MTAGPDLALERPYLERGLLVGGYDEVGRGAFAGPLVVAVVTLRHVLDAPAGLADSKTLTAARREELVAPLEGWVQEWALGEASAQEIDAWGMRRCLAVATTRALAALSTPPEILFVDGPLNVLRPPERVVLSNKPVPDEPYRDLDVVTVVKGDERSATIAAAAIIAKVARDAQMRVLAGSDDPYGWASNKGYGSAAHREALERLGPTSHHRQSWNLLGTR